MLVGKKIWGRWQPERLLLKKPSSGSFTVDSRQRLTKQQLAKWLSLLGQLMEVGFSLQQAVAFSSRVMGSANQQVRLVDGRLNAGESFSQAVCPLVSVDLQVQLSLAEHHGNLTETLSEVGAFLAAQQKQRQKLKGLLQYPLLLMVMLAGLLVALKVFVFPELRTWQTGIRSSWWQNIPWKLVISLVVTVVAVSITCSYFRWRADSIDGRARRLSNLPVIGKMFRYYYGYYLISNLAVMLKHGLSLQECCQVARSFDSQSLLHWWGEALAQCGENGADLLKLVDQCCYLPEELPLFLERGLSTTQLARELTAFHKILFQRLMAATERLLVFVQPVLFLVVAIVIVVMYLSILLPIYHSLQGVY